VHVLLHLLIITLNQRLKFKAFQIDSLSSCKMNKKKLYQKEIRKQVKIEDKEKGENKR
jgi:hypothetical protein